MSSHPLDNVIFDALGTRQTQFARLAPGARRFDPEVSPLCGVQDARDRACWEALATLLPPGATGGALLWEVPDLPPELELLRALPLVQMSFTADGLAAETTPPPPHRRLTRDDAPRMIELVELTEPGPMASRTVDLGTYLGVHDEAERLIAMTGERSRVPGWTEVSAVCTHPDHRGKGLAKALMLAVMRDILARGERPFLHVAAPNTTAQGLYLKLGFTVRRAGQYVIFRRA